MRVYVFVHIAKIGCKLIPHVSLVSVAEWGYKHESECSIKFVDFSDMDFLCVEFSPCITSIKNMHEHTHTYTHTEFKT